MNSESPVCVCELPGHQTHDPRDPIPCCCSRQNTLTYSISLIQLALFIMFWQLTVQYSTVQATILDHPYVSSLCNETLWPWCCLHQGLAAEPQEDPLRPDTTSAVPFSLLLLFFLLLCHGHCLSLSFQQHWVGGWRGVWGGCFCWEDGGLFDFDHQTMIRSVLKQEEKIRTRRQTESMFYRNW